MQIRPLSQEETKEVYRSRMITDFPAKERKPLSIILSQMKKGGYQGVGLYEGDELLAYAFLAQRDANGWVLMDYYAVRGDLRGKGYGSAFISMLWERYRSSAGILVEAESVRSSENEEERAVREKRVRFYRKNGMKTADFFCLLFGVEYEILFLPCEGQARAVSPREGLRSLYGALIPKILHPRNICFSVREDGV